MLILYVKIDFHDTIFKKIFGCAENLFLNEDGKWGEGGAPKNRASEMESTMKVPRLRL